MAERIRASCPMCGMRPFIEQLEAIENEEPVVRLFMLKFGGKKAVQHVEGETYKKIGRGKAPGAMEMIEITDTNKAELVKWQDWFIQRAKTFLESSGSK
jgi:hypothetical protein